MARKNTAFKKISTAQSMAASFHSPVTLIRNLDNVSYQINITTSSSTGTFTVDVSNDYQLDEVGNTVINAGTWVPLTLAGGTPTAAAANDTIVINLTQLSFNAIRVSYVSTIAGTGACDIYILSKQIGG
jgi:hypothetical protein